MVTVILNSTTTHHSYTPTEEIFWSKNLLSRTLKYVSFLDMKELFNILLILGLIMVVANAWALFIIWRHTRSKWRSPSALADIKYFELRSKQEFTVAVGAIFLAALSFYGYNTISGLENKINAQVQESLEKITSLTAQAEKAQADVEKAVSNLNDASAKAITMGNTVDKLSNQINRLNSKSILQNNIYIVPDVPLSQYKIGANNIRTIPFSGLRTVNGDPLPKFARPPNIIVTSSNGGVVLLRDITTTSFSVYPSDAIVLESDNRSSQEIGEYSFIKFDVWIMEKPRKVGE